MTIYNKSTIQYRLATAPIADDLQWP